MEVVSPPGADMRGKSVLVQIGGPQGKRLGPVSFGPFGLGDRFQATLLWAWDTRGLTPGRYNLEFTVDPDGPSWTESVLLQPAVAVPLPEPGAHWASAQSRCCVINYVTGTAAERDIHQIMSIADAQAANASQRMGETLNDPITITLLPRVLGNGGFTGEDISVTYLDRNYAGGDFAIILHHEMIHVLDARLGGDLRPTLLLEGLAVYMTGGHFRREPIMANAAALLQIHNPEQAQAPVTRVASAPGEAAIPADLGWFLPLRTLVDNFYSSQHEVGYLEAAALVAYMVERWGWDGFNKFYRDIHAQPGASQSEAIDAALIAHLGISLDDLQKDFLDRLSRERVAPANINDVQETVAYYDVMRRYQQLLDPSAYFRTAWLLDNKQMREKGIVADYLRHPSSVENLALETLLIAANQDLTSFHYANEEQELEAVKAVLDQVEGEAPDPLAANSLARDYRSIVQLVLSAGYQPQRISVSGETAKAWVTAAGPLLFQLDLRRAGGKWTVFIPKEEALQAGLSLRNVRFYPGVR
jgi:hypothetical protein